MPKRVLLLLAISVCLLAQTPPKDVLGFNIGDDYQMASYSQLETYWKKLATESNRMKLVDIGPTAEGRRQYMAVLSSPENIKNLDKYKGIARRLAQAEGLTEEQARALAKEGKAVVWIDGGLHATETVGSQQLMDLVWQMVSRNDEETLRILRDVIILAVHANPDGQELVANWYMREADPLKRSMTGLPRLYQKYIGHDNNRDFYMSAQAETTNMNRQMFIEWFPQIVYNHHQTGPAGTVIFIPPFRDPFNYHFDPLIPLGVEQVGVAMHARLVAAGKGGSVMRSGASYSTWWNGGLRTVSYFHNMIGILTEIIGNPTPMDIALVPDRQLPTGDGPLPVTPQKWHYRQSLDYEFSNNMAILDLASRNRETLLYNIWRMGMNSIEKGSRDHWTVTPKRIEALKAAADKARGSREAPTATGGGDGPPMAARTAPTELYASVLRDPQFRDPRGYIIPAGQADFPTATKFVNALLKTGITVMTATASFEVQGKTYPAGSFVIKTAQAFRPHVMDMFEPQDHPHDFRYPGGPPVPPYDTAGWTLAYQMGVEFDRVMDDFSGPFKKIEGLAAPLPGAIKGPARPAGHLLSHRANDSFIAANRVLKAGCDVYWLKNTVAVEGQDLGAGALWMPRCAAGAAVLDKSAKELGLTLHAVEKAPAGPALKLQPVRIGLYDQYGGLMTSGWTRWLLEQFEFPFEVVYPQTLDAGNLKQKFDVLVFTDGAFRRAGAGGRGGRGGFGAPAPANIPDEYKGWTGRISEDKTIPALQQFVQAGGTMVTIGGSTSMAELMGVPVGDHLAEKTADGRSRRLPAEKFYIPGSLLRAQVDNTHPLAYGMPESVDVVYDNSPVFQLRPEAQLKKTSAVAWFSGTEPLRSGWAWGQAYLDGGTAVAEATVGEGKMVLLGPEVAFRAQPHGTFKFLFNALYYGSAKNAAIE